MAFQVSRRDLWFKIRDLRGTVSPNLPDIQFREQVEEAFFELSPFAKENVTPELWSKIDIFLKGFVHNVRR